MSTKKIIIALMEKLKRSTDPVESEDLEDQILRLVDQEEDLNDFTNEKPIEYSEKDPEKDVERDAGRDAKQDAEEEIDERETIRLQRSSQRESKEAKYREESKLGSVDEELLRNQLMEEALAYNEDFAYQKSRKHSGAKNKAKKRV